MMLSPLPIPKHLLTFALLPNNMRTFLSILFALVVVAAHSQKTVFVSVENDSVCLVEETPTGKSSSIDDASLWLRADKAGEIIYNCPNQLKQKNAKSGVYKFDPDGDGLNIFEGYYDASEDGGWLMVLNYLHQGGTNPTLNVRTTDLPLIGSSVLGTDESGTTFWGHAAPSVLTQFNVSEVRFYGRTSGHSRIVHFKTSLSNVISYIKSGSGTMSGINGSFTTLSSHSANIPGNATSTYNNQGNLALTNFPYWRNGRHHWGIKGDNTRWEVDDYTGNFSQNTLHRVFIRANCDCPAQSSNPSDGSSGDYWEDMSSYSNIATQTNSSEQPTYNNNSTDNINFNPNFSFSNHHFVVPWSASMNTDSLTIFSIHQIDGGAGTWRTIFGARMYGTASNNGGHNLYASTSDNYQFWTRSTNSSGFNNTPNGAITNLAEILGVDVIEGADGTVPKNIYRNGTTVASVTNGSYTPNPVRDYTIGKNDGGISWPYVGRITEQIVYPKILSSHEKNVVETYLAIKYGITLSHDYISPDTVMLYDVSNGYSSGITGIGKNTTQGLYQKKSKSESDLTAGVTLELTTEISSSSYLIFGFDNGGLGRRRLAGHRYFLNRNYYAEQTGGVGTVNIELDLAAINAAPVQNRAQVKIIISNTANYDNPLLINSDLISGGIAYFYGIPLNDKYFTFKAAP